jgi:hypothetical protein
VIFLIHPVQVWENMVTNSRRISNCVLKIEQFKKIIRCVCVVLSTYWNNYDLEVCDYCILVKILRFRILSIVLYLSKSRPLCLSKPEDGDRIQSPKRCVLKYKQDDF